MTKYYSFPEALSVEEKMKLLARLIMADPENVTLTEHGKDKEKLFLLSRGEDTVVVPAEVMEYARERGLLKRHAVQ